MPPTPTTPVTAKRRSGESASKATAATPTATAIPTATVPKAKAKAASNAATPPTTAAASSRPKGKSTHRNRMDDSEASAADTVIILTDSDDGGDAAAASGPARKTASSIPASPRAPAEHEQLVAMLKAATAARGPLSALIDKCQSHPDASYTDLVQNCLKSKHGDLQELTDARHNLLILGPSGYGKSTLLMRLAMGLTDVPSDDIEMLLPKSGGGSSTTKIITCLKPAAVTASSPPSETYKVSLVLRSPAKIKEFASSRGFSAERGPASMRDAINFKHLRDEQQREEVERLFAVADGFIAKLALRHGVDANKLAFSQAAFFLTKIFEAASRGDVHSCAIEFIVVEGHFPGIPDNMRFFDVPGWGDDLKEWDYEILADIANSDAIVMLATWNMAEKEHLAPLAKLLGKTLLRSYNVPPLLVNAMMFRNADRLGEATKEKRAKHLTAFKSSLEGVIHEQWKKDSAVRFSLQKSRHYLSVLLENVDTFYQLYDTCPSRAQPFLQRLCGRQLRWRLEHVTHALAGACFQADQKTNGDADGGKAGSPADTVNFVKSLYVKKLKTPLLCTVLKESLENSLRTLLTTIAASLANSPHEGELEPSVVMERIQTEVKQWTKTTGMLLVEDAISRTTEHLGILIVVNRVRAVYEKEANDTLASIADEEAAALEHTAADVAVDDDDSGAGLPRPKRAKQSSIKRRKPAQMHGRGKNRYVDAISEDHTNLDWQDFRGEDAVTVALSFKRSTPSLSQLDKERYTSLAEKLHATLTEQLGAKLWKCKQANVQKNGVNRGTAADKSERVGGKAAAAEGVSEVAQAAANFRKSIKRLATQLAATHLAGRALDLAKYDIVEELLQSIKDSNILETFVEKANSFIVGRLKSVRESLVHKVAPPEIRKAVEELVAASKALSSTNKTNRPVYLPKKSQILKEVACPLGLGIDAVRQMQIEEKKEVVKRVRKREKAVDKTGSACAADGVGISTAPASDEAALRTWTEHHAPKFLAGMIRRGEPVVGARLFDVELADRPADALLAPAHEEDARCGHITFHGGGSQRAVIHLGAAAKQTLRMHLIHCSDQRAKAKLAIWPMFQVLMSEKEARLVMNFFDGEQSNDMQLVEHLCVFLCANVTVMRALLDQLKLAYGDNLSKLAFVALAAPTGTVRSDVLMEIARKLCLDNSVKYFWLLPPTPTIMYVYDELIVGTERCTFLAGLRSCELVLEALEEECVGQVLDQDNVGTKLVEELEQAQASGEAGAAQHLMTKYLPIIRLSDSFAKLGKTDAPRKLEALLTFLETNAADIPISVLTSLLKPLAPWLRASTLYTKAGMYTVQTCLSLPSSHVSVQGQPQYNYMSPVLFSTYACAHAHLVGRDPKMPQPPLEQLPTCPLVTTKKKPSADTSASPTPDDAMDTASDDASSDAEGAARNVAGRTPPTQPVMEALKRYVHNKLYKKSSLRQISPLRIAFYQKKVKGASSNA